MQAADAPAKRLLRKNSTSVCGYTSPTYADAKYVSPQYVPMCVAEGACVGMNSDRMRLNHIAWSSAQTNSNRVQIRMLVASNELEEVTWADACTARLPTMNTTASCSSPPKHWVTRLQALLAVWAGASNLKYNLEHTMVACGCIRQWQTAATLLILNIARCWLSMECHRYVVVMKTRKSTCFVYVLSPPLKPTQLTHHFQVLLARGCFALVQLSNAIFPSINHQGHGECV